jgi:hypothetical protein
VAGLGKKIGGILLIALAISLVSYRSYAMYQDHEFREGYRTMSIGDSEESLLTLVGKPDKLTDGTIWPDTGGKKLTHQLANGCVKEYWYVNYLRFQVSSWSYCFDGNDKLLHKNDRYRYRYGWQAT